MRILHFCFILSFILSPILEYNNQEILIENFEIIENDEEDDEDDPEMGDYSRYNFS